VGQGGGFIVPAGVGTRPEARRGWRVAELFPDDVRRFLDENVESIDQLEILRLLWENPDAEWTETSLSGEVQTPPQVVSAHLVALSARGLLHADPRGAGWVCRYGPRDPERDAVLRKAMQLYRERPVSMIKLVAARATDPLRTFADAFRVRPREGE
jgi:hypothetical protein